MGTPVIVEAARTPIGKRGGGWPGCTPPNCSDWPSAACSSAPTWIRPGSSR